jgi:hypothetical protein
MMIQSFAGNASSAANGSSSINSFGSDQRAASPALLHSARKLPDIWTRAAKADRLKQALGPRLVLVVPLSPLALERLTIWGSMTLCSVFRHGTC